MYADCGFLFFQSVLESYVMQAKYNLSSVLPFDNKTGLLQSQMRLAPFPTAAYIADSFADYVAPYLGLFLTLVFLWPVTRIVSLIVEEKELRIKVGARACVCVCARRYGGACECIRMHACNACTHVYFFFGIDDSHDVCACICLSLPTFLPSPPLLRTSFHPTGGDAHDWRL